MHVNLLFRNCSGSWHQCTFEDSYPLKGKVRKAAVALAMDGSKQHCTCGVTNPRDKTGRQHANENIKAMVKQLTKLWYTKAAGL